MTEPTQTPQKRPTTTVIATRALKGTGEHKLTEAAFGLFGIAILAADGYFLFKHPPAGLGDQLFHGAIGLIGLALIPGAATRAAEGIKQVGGSLAGIWKAKDSGTPPT